MRVRLRRIRLGQLKVARAKSFRMHDFRRGHAQDMASKGKSLALLLRAGDWRSSAFATYLDLPDIQSRAVLETALNAEGSDED